MANPLISPQTELPRGAIGFALSGGADFHPILEAEFFGTPTPVKRWNGSAWVDAAVTKWNGSAWVDAAVTKWNGSAWVAA